MSSAIVNYRTDVINAIKSSVSGLNTVDWYDAIFDEDDVKEWSLMTPAAFVAVRDTTGLMHSTGELNMSLDIGVVVITSDVGNRDADAANWAILEQIIILADYNRFGNVNAAIPNNMRMSRLREPELRKMGVALGLVEWTAGLTIGKNFAEQQMYAIDPITGQRITQFPNRLVVGTSVVAQQQVGSMPAASPATATETVTLNPDGEDSDPAAIVFDPVSSLDPFKPIP